MCLTYPEAPLAYSGVYLTGDFVQRGNVLGLSQDHGSVVVAPTSGWVRLIEADSLMHVEIWLSPDFEGEANCLLIVAR